MNDGGVLHQEHVNDVDPGVVSVMRGDGSLITDTSLDHIQLVREEFATPIGEVQYYTRAGTYELFPSEAELAARYGHHVLEKTMCRYQHNGRVTADIDQYFIPPWKKMDRDSIKYAGSWVATWVVTPRTNTLVPHPKAPDLRGVSRDIGGTTFIGYYQMAPDFLHHIDCLDKGTGEWMQALLSYIYYQAMCYWLRRCVPCILADHGHHTHVRFRLCGGLRVAPYYLQ